jgi:hypothetical protein
MATQLSWGRSKTEIFLPKTDLSGVSFALPIQAQHSHEWDLNLELLWSHPSTFTKQSGGASRKGEQVSQKQCTDLFVEPFKTARYRHSGEIVTHLRDRFCIRTPSKQQAEAVAPCGPNTGYPFCLCLCVCLCVCFGWGEPHRMTPSPITQHHTTPHHTTPHHTTPHHTTPHHTPHHT